MARRSRKALTLGDLPDNFHVPEAVLERVQALTPTLAEAALEILRGRRPGESRERQKLIAERQSVQQGRPLTPADVEAQERIIGSDDLLPIAFFSRGLLAARSVARIEVEPLNMFGTGFLVAPDMLMTNNHVLPMPSLAGGAKVAFEQFDEAGRLLETRIVDLDPDRFFFTHVTLDVTVVAVRESPECREATEDLGWHPMVAQEGKIRKGDPVNIIQHPGGRPKMVVVHNSNLLHIENVAQDRAHMEQPDAPDKAALRDPFLWYSSDTEHGSSGAPVFNARWEVVGVHHRSVPAINEDGELVDVHRKPITAEAFRTNPDVAVWIANEGTRTSRIVAALEATSFARLQPARARERLLDLWESSRGHNQGLDAAARAIVARKGVVDGREAGRYSVVAGGVTVQIMVIPNYK